MHELGIAHGHNKKELNHTHLNEIPKKEDNPSIANKVINENQSQSINWKTLLKTKSFKKVRVLIFSIRTDSYFGLINLFIFFLNQFF